MKKSRATLLLLFSFVANFLFSQNDYTGFRLGAVYHLPERPVYDKYLSDLSDSLLLTTKLNANPAYGIGISYLVHADKGEFEFGGHWALARKTVLVDSTDGYAIAKSRDFGIVTGGSYFPVRWFFIGGAMAINSFGGDIKASDLLPAAQSRLDNAPDSKNIFRGYSLMARGQAGLSGKMVRLAAYYDIGTKFNFYTASDHIMTNYSGSKKTGFSVIGFSLQFVIRND